MKEQISVVLSHSVVLHSFGSHWKLIQAGGIGELPASFQMPLPRVDTYHFCSHLNGQSKSHDLACLQRDGQCKSAGNQKSGEQGHMLQERSLDS